jgi:hypothetical protein
MKGNHEEICLSPSISLIAYFDSQLATHSFYNILSTGDKKNVQEHLWVEQK